MITQLITPALSDVLIRLEQLECLFNNKTDNKQQTIDNKPDNNDDSQPSGEDWVNLATIAAQLEVLPKSILELPANGVEISATIRLSLR